MAPLLAYTLRGDGSSPVGEPRLTPAMPDALELSPAQPGVVEAEVGAAAGALLVAGLAVGERGFGQGVELADGALRHAAECTDSGSMRLRCGAISSEVSWLCEGRHRNVRP